jgi:hypothetical protein
MITGLLSRAPIPEPRNAFMLGVSLEEFPLPFAHPTSIVVPMVRAADDEEEEEEAEDLDDDDEGVEEPVGPLEQVDDFDEDDFDDDFDDDFEEEFDDEELTSDSAGESFDDFDDAD